MLDSNEPLFVVLDKSYYLANKRVFTENQCIVTTKGARCRARSKTNLTCSSHYSSKLSMHNYIID